MWFHYIEIFFGFFMFFFIRNGENFASTTLRSWIELLISFSEDIRETFPDVKVPIMILTESHTEPEPSDRVRRTDHGGKYPFKLDFSSWLHRFQCLSTLVPVLDKRSYRKNGVVGRRKKEAPTWIKNLSFFTFNEFRFRSLILPTSWGTLHRLEETHGRYMFRRTVSTSPVLSKTPRPALQFNWR